DLPIPDAPGAVMQRLQGKAIAHPTWTLKYPPGLPQEVFITLRGRAAKNKLGEVVLPEVQVENVVGPHWLIWQDAEIHTESGKKLASQKPAKNLAAYQTDGWFRDEPAWSFAPMERALKAVVPRTSPRTVIRILASEEKTH